MSPALAGRILTIGPPGKSDLKLFNYLSLEFPFFTKVRLSSIVFSAFKEQWGWVGGAWEKDTF